MQDGGRPDGGRDGGLSGGDVSADVLRRLRERVDRNVRLVDRMRADPLAPEPPGLPELIDTARRMRHDAETLLLLAGIDAGPRPGAPARLAALLDEAVDATDEPMRVDVRSGPNATVEPGAAIELLHVVSEVVDHVTAIHPGARVEVASRTEAPGGIVVEIRTASTTRYDPSGRRGMAAATRIAQRSRSGIVLRTPLPGPANPGAPIATIHCPARAVTVHELDYSPWPDESSYDALGRPGIGGSNGALHRDFARETEAVTPAHGLPLDRQGGLPSPRTTVEALFSELTAETNARAAGRPPDPTGGPSGTTDRFGAYGRASEPRNGRAYPAAPPVDELFGPMVDLPAEHHPEATPIYEAVASAWFRGGRRGRRRGRLGIARRSGMAGRGRAGRPPARGRHVHGRGAAAAAAGRQAGAAPAGRGQQRRRGRRPRPPRCARRAGAGPGARPRPRAPGHLPARTASGQAPRRPDRPRRSRRLVSFAPFVLFIVPNPPVVAPRA